MGLWFVTVWGSKEGYNKVGTWRTVSKVETLEIYEMAIYREFGDVRNVSDPIISGSSGSALAIYY